MIHQIHHFIDYELCSRDHLPQIHSFDLLDASYICFYESSCLDCCYQYNLTINHEKKLLDDSDAFCAYLHSGPSVRILKTYCYSSFPNTVLRQRSKSMLPKDF